MLFQVEAGLSMKIGKEILKFPKTFDSSANISNWKQQLRKTTGLRTFLSPLAHSATSLIDLKLSEKELLQNMHRMTRYNIGLAHRRNLIFKTIPLKNFTKQNEKDFFSILNEWSHRKNVYGFEEHLMRAIMRAFKKESWCHFVELNGKLISTLLMLKFGRVAVYYCAVSSKDGYAQKAPTALVWEGILAAKKAGCEILDFGGIYDPRYKDSYKRWTGFSKFKEGFSPTPFLYPPSVRYPVLWWINP
jgi:lipid II:glycine glycyltransferase (peptidoglycan interpeptide bridge formation enzyme)